MFLALDMSGSMSGPPIRQAKDAMKQFVDSLIPQGFRVGLIPFSDKAICEIEPTTDARKIKAAIDKLTIGSYYGYGNSAHPFDVARERMQRQDVDARYIVVLTDGVWSYSDRAIAAAKRCHQEQIEVIAHGFGSADKAFLRKIASTDEFASFGQLSDLGGSFSKIAQAIGENSSALCVD